MVETPTRQNNGTHNGRSKMRLRETPDLELTREGVLRIKVTSAVEPRKRLIARPISLKPSVSVTR
jgi:hypothetical protein